ncbi:hypothetical protein CEY16_04435 [Halalkalibacillus sediminis]|uniref:DUF1189 domain-containing protein n=1 Tax=Halalkalibacillus sediminis TaxID=2018042 RepID=A0A2I0QXD7_9BACI|nr:DUF1189 family protein [Halalkalibacillus sediminis]PKR79002.1 hypothetical protein CEY16_04435 [Halalkalibacillus sediminis]
MKKINMFKRFYWSLLQFKKVSALRIEKVGKSIGFVFFLMMLLTFPYAINLTLDATQALSSIEKASETEDSTFTYNEEEQSADEEIIFENDSLIITTVEDDFTSKKNILFLNHNQGMLKTPSNSYSFMYSSMFSEGETFTLDDLHSELANFIYVLLILSVVTFYLLSTTVKFVEVSLLSLGGLMGNKSMKRNLNYAQIWKLSAYAVTVPSIVVFIYDRFASQQMISGFLFWIGSFVILYFISSFVPKKAK